MAARWMGWETLAWCEIDPFCRKVLTYHFPEAEAFEDIKKSDFTKYANRIDILSGGFPCQPFSTAGKRGGTSDDRWLWPEAVRIVGESEPTWFLFENPPGLKSVGLDGVLTYLEALGYEVGTLNIPACAVNAPHRRDRVWIIANNGSKRAESFGTDDRNEIIRAEIGRAHV